MSAATATEATPSAPGALLGLSQWRMLTVNDVARICAVDENTVRIWTRKGKLPAPVRLGRELRWTPESIARAIGATE